MPDEPREDRPSEGGLWGDVFKELPGSGSGRSGVRDRPKPAEPADRPEPEPPAPAPPEAPPDPPPAPRDAPRDLPPAPPDPPPEASAPVVEEPPLPPPVPVVQEPPAPPPPVPVAPPGLLRPEPRVRPRETPRPHQPPAGRPPARDQKRRRPIVPAILALLVLVGAGIGGFALARSADDGESEPARSAPRAEQRAVSEYDTLLESAILTLNERVARGRTRLRSARTRRGQAQAAGGLGGAYDLAARSLGGSPPPDARARANATIVSALRATSGAYRDLGRAARRANRRRYAAAAQAVARREGELRRSLASPVAQR